MNSFGLLKGINHGLDTVRKWNSSLSLGITVGLFLCYFIFGKVGPLLGDSLIFGKVNPLLDKDAHGVECCRKTLQDCRVQYACKYWQHGHPDQRNWRGTVRLLFTNHLPATLTPIVYV